LDVLTTLKSSGIAAAQYKKSVENNPAGVLRSVNQKDINRRQLRHEHA
jgi:hypothetical protein